MTDPDTSTKELRSELKKLMITKNVRGVDMGVGFMSDQTVDQILVLFTQALQSAKKDCDLRVAKAEMDVLERMQGKEQKRKEEVEGAIPSKKELKFFDTKAFDERFVGYNSAIEEIRKNLGLDDK